MRPAADADFVICPNASCGQVLVLPSRRLLCPAADSDIEIPINRKKMFRFKCKQDIWNLISMLVTNKLSHTYVKKDP